MIGFLSTQFSSFIAQQLVNWGQKELKIKLTVRMTETINAKFMVMLFPTS